MNNNPTEDEPVLGISIEGGEVGRLYLKDNGELGFDGNAHESAKILFNGCIKLNSKHIKGLERKLELIEMLTFNEQRRHCKNAILSREVNQFRRWLKSSNEELEKELND